MPVIELRSIDSDLGRNKLCFCNRAVVITAIQSQRILVTAPVPYVEIVMWNGDLQWRKARQGAGPLSQLLLLLALCIGLITFACLHSVSVAEHSLNAPCPLRDRLCRAVQRRPGETLLHFREVQRLCCDRYLPCRFHEFNSQCATTRRTPFLNVTEWCDEDLQKVPSKSWYRDRWLSQESTRDRPLLAQRGHSPRQRGQLNDITAPLPRRRTCTPARASDFSSHKRLTGIPLCRVPPPVANEPTA